MEEEWEGEGEGEGEGERFILCVEVGEKASIDTNSTRTQTRGTNSYIRAVGIRHRPIHEHRRP